MVETARGLSRVLLITDYTSRIPVYVSEARVRTIMAGNNTDRPDLLYVPLENNIESGMEVLTSGHGGTFPPGIPVGLVVIDPDTRGLRVEPYALREETFQVSILDHPFVTWQPEPTSLLAPSPHETSEQDLTQRAPLLPLLPFFGERGEATASEHRERVEGHMAVALATVNQLTNQLTNQPTNHDALSGNGRVDG